jgi:hypothetical protein
MSEIQKAEVIAALIGGFIAIWIATVPVIVAHLKRIERRLNESAEKEPKRDAERQQILRQTDRRNGGRQADTGGDRENVTVPDVQPDNEVSQD